jgi:peptide/nickel transport system substrate-binding protein
VIRWILISLLTFSAAHAAALEAGGRLVVVQRSEARTFNPIVEIDEASRTVNWLLHGRLARTNPATRRLEPSLAESWRRRGNGTEILVRLREGLRFSDGAPLTVSDVLFSFAVFSAEKNAASRREILLIDGKPVQVRKLDGNQIVITLPGPSALGERILESIPILPAHKFGNTEPRGVWGVSTDPAGIVGAGPFRLKKNEPGQRLTLERNPHYWRLDAKQQRLPYLDEIQFVYASSEDAMAARLLAGEADVATGMSGGTFEALRTGAGSESLEARDLGPGLEYTFLFFNLNQGPGGTKRPAWLNDPRFRRAVALAADREAIARLCYRGHATPVWGHMTPARGAWFDASLPRPAQSIGAARKLLAESGFQWDNDGRLFAPGGIPASLTIIASASNPVYGQIAALLQEDLKRIGLKVTAVNLEFRSLIDRVTVRKDFDAAIMAMGPGEADPAADMNVLLSGGRVHLWNLSGTAHSWETPIDELLRRQLSTPDPKRRIAMVHEIQRRLFEQAPFTGLASPNMLAVHRRGLQGIVPLPGAHLVLSNADLLFWSKVLHVTRSPK